LPNGQRGLDLIKMEFRRFLHAIVLLPAQIVRTARPVIYRIMSYNGSRISLLPGSTCAGSVSLSTIKKGNYRFQSVSTTAQPCPDTAKIHPSHEPEIKMATKTTQAAATCVPIANNHRERTPHIRPPGARRIPHAFFRLFYGGRRTRCRYWRQIADQ